MVVSLISWTVLGIHIKAGFIAVCSAAAVCLDVVGYFLGCLSGGLVCGWTGLESFL